MSLRPRGRAAFVVFVCLALGGAEIPGSEVDRLAAPRSRIDLRGSLFSPGFSIRHSTSDSIVVTLSLGDLTIQPRTTRAGLQHRVLLDGGERLEWAGAPDLPVYRILVAVPDGGDIRVTARPRARTVVTGLNVPLLTTKDDPSSQKARVLSDRMTPTAIAAVEHHGYLRGQRLASVLVSPARYSGTRRELEVTTDLEVIIRVEDATGDVLKNIGPLQGVLKGTVLNADLGHSPWMGNVSAGVGRHLMSGGGQVCWCTGTNWQDAAASAISCGADYLIIVSDSLVASTMVDTLAMRRAEYNGFNVAIVQMSQIDADPDTASTPVSIRALIDSIYTSESAAHMGDGRLGYVLLVGDAYDINRQVLIPSYYGYATLLNDYRKASDAYYSFLDDDPVDRFPDVLIGRLPVDRDDTDWEITNMVRKIVSYEPLSGDVWADSILAISGSDPNGFTFPPSLNGFRAFFDTVLTYYAPPGKVTVQEHRLALGAAQDTTKHRIFGNKIRASMARGKWLTAFFDHGNPFYWVGSFYPRSYEFIPDTGRPSIVFSIGSNTTQFDLTADWALNVMGLCDVGDGCTVEAPSSIQCESPGYSVVDPCDVIAERLLVQEGGAVAVIGYSRTQYTNSAQADFTNLFRCLSDQNPSTLGELLVGARMFGISSEITARNLMLLGDPALDIRTRAPAAEDTVDVAIGVHDIRLNDELEGETAYYVNSKSTLALSARIRNPWRIDAAGVDVAFWQGEPGAQGSTLLGSTTLDLVPAYDSVLVNFNVGDPSGTFEVFVVLDPDDEIAERNEDNNVAFRSFLGLPYKGDYPARLTMSPSRPIVVADLTSDMGREFLVSGSWEVRCYSASDTAAQWSHQVDLTENELLMNTPVVGHLFKSSARYVAIETRAPSMSSLLRIVSGESGATIGVDTLSQNASIGGDAALSKWVVTDLGPDDRTMELVGLSYHQGEFVRETYMQAYVPLDSLLVSLVV